MLQALENVTEHICSALSGHDHTEEESAEDDVEADPPGDEGRTQKPCDHDGEDARGQPTGASVGVGQPLEQGLDDHEHDHHESDRLPEDAGGLTETARAGHGHYDRQDRPCQDVVDRRAGQRHGADLDPLHAPLGQHSRQHREGRDGHRDADKEGEGPEGHGPSRDTVVVVIDEGSKPEPESERQRDRADRDDRGDTFSSPDQGQVELQTDDEHEHDQPDLGDHVQVRADQEGKETHRGIPGKLPEEAGSEDESRHDLSDHRRLTEAPGEDTHTSRHQDDDGNVEEDDGNDLIGRLRMHEPSPPRAPNRVTTEGSTHRLRAPLLPRDCSFRRSRSGPNGVWVVPLDGHGMREERDLGKVVGGLRPKRGAGGPDR